MNEPALALRVADLVRICREAFGPDRIEAIVQHGSSIKGGAIPGYSDVDFQVFLVPDCFDIDGHLPDETVFTFQDAFGPLDWSATGFNYPQVYFYDRHKLPDWWTGPMPGTYRELVGRLPAEAQATDEKLRQGSTRLLKALPNILIGELGGFVDTIEGGLPRRLRLLGTTVTPTVFALISCDADHAMSLWALSKFEALKRLQARFPATAGPALAHRFYDDVAYLYGERFEPQRAREAFKTGIRFLRWAESIGHDLPEETPSV